jgi:isoquinoline 1-oxidoreductase beta subunit
MAAAATAFMPYSIPDTRADARDAKHPIWTVAWRSVLKSQHGFRRAPACGEGGSLHLPPAPAGDDPRFKAVLERVAAMARWTSPLPPREGRGISIVESFGSIVDQVAHVAVTPTGSCA